MDTPLNSKSHYLLKSRQKLHILSLFVLLLLISFIIDVATGPGDFSLNTILEVLLTPDSHGTQLNVIVWELRLPIALMAILVGAMLSAAGAEMQTILANPLADPFTLGISSAASFGAALAIILNLNANLIVGSAWVTIFAFIFAIFTSFLIYLVTRIRGASNESMILIGIALLFAFNALLGLLQYSANDVELVQIIFWMMGSLAKANWESIIICFLVLIITIPFIIYRSWMLTALRMGDDKAASLGVNIDRLRIEMLIVISLLAATAVSFVGTIGFIGLVGPHIARMLVGENQRIFLPLSIITGALMMSVSSIVSKSITPGAIYPIGIVTSLIGIPLFVVLILSLSRRSWK